MSVFEPNDNLPVLRGNNPPAVSREGLVGNDIVSLEWQRRIGFALLTVVIGLGLGVFSLLLAGEKGSIAWLAVAIVGTSAIALLMRFFSVGIIGFLLICWIAVGTPSVAEGGSGGGGKSILISQAGLLLLLSLWVGRMFLMRKFELVKTPVNFPIFLYLMVCLLSTLAGILFPNAAVQAFSPKQYIQVNILENLTRWLALGGLLLLGNNLTGRMVTIGAIAVALPGVLTFSGVLSFIPASFFLAFQQVISMAVLTALAVLSVNKMPVWVRIAAGLIALSIFTTYFLKGTEWVSGWMSALIALVIIFYLGNRKILYAGIAAAVLVVFLNANYFYEKVYKSNFYGDGPATNRVRQGQMGTFENDRVRMLRGAFRYAETFPLGVGLGNYRSYNTYFGRVEVWNTTTFTSAHGTYSQALSETGWPGLLSLFILIVACCKMMYRYYKFLPEGSWAKAYVLGGYAGCIGNFCASFIGDYLFPAYHNGGMGSFGTCVYTWFMVGITIAIGRHYNLEWDKLGLIQVERERLTPVFRRALSTEDRPEPV